LRIPFADTMIRDVISEVTSVGVGATLQAVEEMVSEHVDSGCESHLRRVKRSRTCAAKGCKDKMVAVAVTCVDCAGVFCVRHRAGNAHKCAGASCATEARRAASTPWAMAAAARAARGLQHALVR
jgi:hypothetical protein